MRFSRTRESPYIFTLSFQKPGKSFAFLHEVFLNGERLYAFKFFDSFLRIKQGQIHLETASKEIFLNAFYSI
jgi:hypothetical protein